MRILVLHNNNLPNSISSGSSYFASNGIKLVSRIFRLPKTDVPDFDTFTCRQLDDLKDDHYDLFVLPLNMSEHYMEYTSLRIATHIRLTPNWKSLSTPILFLGIDKKDEIMHYSYFGELLNTYNVFYSSKTKQEELLSIFKFIEKYSIDHLINDEMFVSSSEYKDFLHRMKTIPVPANYATHHSIANEWAIMRWIGMFDWGSQREPTIVNEDFMHMLYFKYLIMNSGVKLSNINKDKMSLIIDGIKGKRVVYIDDEANKGWKSIFYRIFTASGIKDSDFVVYDFAVNKKSMRKKNLIGNIESFLKKDYSENGGADCYIIDLRLHDDDFSEASELSGHKISAYIKNELNKGNQVLIFTASNKVWNLQKEISDIGVDGYIIKESPESGLSEKSLTANVKLMIDNIKKCISRGYLKEIYSSIENLKKNFKKNEKSKTDNEYKAFLNEILKQIDLSFELVNLTDPTKDDDEAKRRFANAYIALYQVIEQINRQFVIKDKDGRWRLGNINGIYATGMKNDLSCHYSLQDKSSDWKYPEWMKVMSLFNDLWKQKDDAFIRKIHNLIDKRSAFIHDNKEELSTVHKDIYTSVAFVDLFNCIIRLCGFL